MKSVDRQWLSREGPILIGNGLYSSSLSLRKRQKPFKELFSIPRLTFFVTMEVIKNGN